MSNLLCFRMRSGVVYSIVIVFYVLALGCQGGAQYKPERSHETPDTAQRESLEDFKDGGNSPDLVQERSPEQTAEPAEKQPEEQREHTKLPDTIAKSSQAIVVSYHRQATQAALQIMKEGGNAFDAFIAATFVQYVLTPGATSLGGPLGALLYDKKTQQIQYLDATYNSLQDAQGAWTPGSPSKGKSILVPGAPAGLEALSKRYGKLPLTKVLAPAIRLAKDGFVVSPVYSTLAKSLKQTLESTPYGKALFFPNGTVIQPGVVLKQPDLADTFTQFGKQGSGHFYTGGWAKKLLSLVTTLGGKMKASDLADYQAIWRKPRVTAYRGKQIYSASGLSYGATSNLLSLKLAEKVKKWPKEDIAKSPDLLEITVRISRRMWGESWLFAPEKMSDNTFVSKQLSTPYVQSVWDTLKKDFSKEALNFLGSHSYSLAVVDKYGNAIVGTHTVESPTWGDGIFLGGVLLNSSGKLYQYRSVQPGKRRITPISVHMGMKDKRWTFGIATFGYSLVETAFQLLLEQLEYQKTPQKSVDAHRFGFAPYDPKTGKVDTTKNWLDPKVPASLVQTLKQRGLQFEQSGYAMDVGYGVCIQQSQPGQIQGAYMTFRYGDEGLVGRP